MKVAIVRVKAIHHGLTARPLGVIAWLISFSDWLRFRFQLVGIRLIVQRSLRYSPVHRLWLEEVVQRVGRAQGSDLER